jgi:hypothetical protein
VAAQPVRLKALLRERHWQKHATFCREYDKAAESVDPELKGSYPSRAQLHRWLSGELKGLPYPDHCRILEKMLPGWTAAELFEPWDEDTASIPHMEDLDVPELFKTIGAGLDTPDSRRAEWGPAAQPKITERVNISLFPAPLSDTDIKGASATANQIGRNLLTLGKLLRLEDSELQQLAGLAGNVVELDQRLDIDIATDGWAQVSYKHELFNMSSRPMTRLTRELWFEHTRGPLTIVTVDQPDRRVSIQRKHDTASLAKFACQISPPIQPGETAVIAYECEGGQFLEDHYWRQAFPQYTRHFTMSLRHRGAGRLVNCTATEEHTDGSENSAGERLLWDYDGNDVTITITRDYLRPGQAITLRWTAEHAPA